MDVLCNRVVFILVSVFAGVFSTYWIAGTNILDTANLAWMLSEDPVAHFLGWSFFRHGEWTWPLGLNPDYGMELSSSVVYSDSIPLFALLFKVFNPWLSETFQYFGLWVLFCLCMQAAGGFALATRFSANLLIRTSVALMVCLTPAMTARLGGHLALFGHFVLVWAVVALVDHLSQRPVKIWWWLLPVSALIHPYLLVMVLGVFVAGQVYAYCSPTRAVSFGTGVSAVGPLLLMMFACAAAGYFVGESSAASSHGYGLYRMNLATFLDSNGWSRWLPDLSNGQGDYEGFAYLGVGYMALIGLGLLMLAHGKVRGWWRSRAFGFSALLALFLVLFAASNQVAAGAYEFRYPLPDFVLNLAGVFRSSGRFIWPVLYLMMAACLWVLLRTLPSRLLAVLFPACVGLQLYDLQPGIQAYRSGLMAEKRSGIAQPLQDERWREIGAHFRNLRAVPAGQIAPNWQALADVARRFRMRTDAVYLARVPQARVAELQGRTHSIFSSGQYEPDTVYVLTPGATIPDVAATFAAGHWMGRIEGMCVLVPTLFERNRAGLRVDLFGDRTGC